jgi:hypothetical protein
MIVLSAQSERFHHSAMFLSWDEVSGVQKVSAQ